MITIISGTNRPNSKSILVSNHIKQLLAAQSIESQVLDLARLKNSDFDHDYDGKQLSEPLKAVQEQYIFSAQKIIYIVAEYNGGIPGILKYFIDSISVREYAKNFKDKKALLVGLSAGRGGNSRGIESLTGVLNYLGVTVYPNKLPLSLINTITDEKEITDEPTLETLNDLLPAFGKF